ncbi:hypothetical protein [Pseudonocardia sp. TRM90224]|uniref:hypothetical protein n=1 Tax=Pseudonocardia sp. TRM90224 TaxID=2812678 RepID=UPI001E3A29A8|nr:hypothetical protein [Pseudonocardia sp. TRM90224]
MLRLGFAVIGLEVAALVVAVLGFGWPVLLIGGPLLLGTVLVLLVCWLLTVPRRKLQEHRANRWAEANADVAAAPQRGLMSGFFEIPVQGGPVDDVQEARR